MWERRWRRRVRARRLFWWWERPRRRLDAMQRVKLHAREDMGPPRAIKAALTTSAGVRSLPRCGGVPAKRTPSWANRFWYSLAWRNGQWCSIAHKLCLTRFFRAFFRRLQLQGTPVMLRLKRFWFARRGKCLRWLPMLLSVYVFAKKSFCWLRSEGPLDDRAFSTRKSTPR